MSLLVDILEAVSLPLTPRNCDVLFYLSKRKKVKVKVTQSCPTLCNPMDYTVHESL